MTLSAQEFTRWMVWMQAEQIGPEWDALRHAQLQAAAANGALSKPDRKPFTAADFMRRDPWAPQAELPRFLNPADAALANVFQVSDE